MKNMIGRKEYDTETAIFLKRFTYGSWGDPSGYEELLYQCPDGLYFVYVCGGIASPYPGEDILRLAKNKVDTWLAERQ